MIVIIVVISNHKEYVHCIWEKRKRKYAMNVERTIGTHYDFYTLLPNDSYVIKLNKVIIITTDSVDFLRRYLSLSSSFSFLLSSSLL